MFSISKVAEQLQVTPQAIYKQRDYLLDHGYMVKDKFGQWQISVQGYNYLKEKRISKLNQAPKIVKIDNEEAEKEQKETTQNSSVFELKEVYRNQVELLEKQIEELKEDRNYFKNLYEEKDRQLNQYINTHLLPSGNATEHKSFFQRFFKK